MIIDFFAKFPSIQFFYEKMRKALSLMGVADALQELLEELEWNKKTEDTFNFFLQRIQQIEFKDRKNFDEATKWIDSYWKSIRSNKWQNQELKNQFIQTISQQEQEIKEGRELSSSSYLHVRIQFFEKIVKQIAEYGEFDVLKGLGKTQTYSISISPGKEPFVDLIEKPKVIMPFSEEGCAISKALNSGFIKAEVLPPAENGIYNRNFINKGLITCDL